MSWRVAILLMALAAGGCETRVEEPPPKAHPTSKPEPAPSSNAAAPGTSADPLAHRCIVPTPAEAERPLVEGADPACPDDPTGPPPLKHGKVSFEGGASVDVEIAREVDHRQRGLMYRKSMPHDAGMIFVFERPRVQRFWMKNTCISLDMLFIDHDGLIVGIEENVPTMNTNTYSANCPAKYVLELNAGWTRRHGVKAGQKVTLSEVDP